MNMSRFTMRSGLAIALLGAGIPAALAQRPATPAPPPATPPAPATAAPTPPAPAATPAAAPAPAESGRTWMLNCADGPAPRECRLSTTALLQPSNQRLAQVILTRQPETRSLGLVFQAPHGASLPAGLAWQVDEGEVQRLAFQSSDAEGLYTGVPVADDLLASLRRGTTLRLTFVIAARREALTVPVPLAQFAEASAEFFAAERIASPAPAAPTTAPAGAAPAPAPRR
jgi:invasion protein IalB